MATARVSRGRKPVLDEQVEQGKILVTASAYGSELPEEERMIEVTPFKSEPAFIKIGAGVTKSLTNYEFLRVDVAITLPCYPEEIDNVKTFLMDKVSQTLTEHVAMYLDDEGVG